MTGNYTITGNEYITLQDSLGAEVADVRLSDVKAYVLDEVPAIDPPSSNTEPELGDIFRLDTFKDRMCDVFDADDVTDGNVSNWQAVGSIANLMSQNNSNLQLVKNSGDNGVTIPAGSYLECKGERDNLTSYRTAIAVFKVDASAATGTDEAVIYCANAGDNGAGGNSPKISYRKDEGLRVQIQGRNSSGTQYVVFKTHDVIADGSDWNVVLFFLRYGKPYLRLNGVDAGRPLNDTDNFVFERSESVPNSTIGSSTSSITSIVNYIELSDSMPCEALVQKLEAAAAYKVGKSLPSGHPYETAEPVVDDTDYPIRYNFDQTAWDTWIATSEASNKLVNHGGVMPSDSGFHTLIKMDFKDGYPLIDKSDHIIEDIPALVGPRYDLGVEITAEIAAVNVSPNMYEVDNTGNGTLALGLDNNTTSGNTRGSVLATVNQAGTGWFFEGGAKIIKMRYKTSGDTAPLGAFPAIFAYSEDEIVYRNKPNIEIDITEPDGQDFEYCNIGSSHLHEGQNAGWNGNLSTDADRTKIYGGKLDNALFDVNKPTGNVNLFDGEWRTIELMIDDDFSYYGITGDKGNGEERLEIARTPTPTEYLQNLYLIVDYALKNHGDLLPNQRTEMVIDYIEVKKKTNTFSQFSLPFTARPSLSGTAKVGQTITCNPNISGVDDVIYHWIAGGEPREINRSGQYICNPQDQGKKIRCVVRAVGHKDKGFAYSETTANVIVA